MFFSDKNNTVQSLLDQFNRHWSSNNLDGLANMYDENVVFINQVEPKQIFYGRARESGFAVELCIFRTTAYAKDHVGIGTGFKGAYIIERRDFLGTLRDCQVN